MPKFKMTVNVSETRELWFELIVDAPDDPSALTGHPADPNFKTLEARSRSLLEDIIHNRRGRNILSDTLEHMEVLEVKFEALLEPD